MSGPLSFANFLDGALSGFETGMDLREKYDIYKERKKTREDKAAARKAIGDKVSAQGQQAASGTPMGPPRPAAAAIGAGSDPRAAGPYGPAAGGQALLPRVVMTNGVAPAGGPYAPLERQYPGMTRAR